MLLNSTQSAYPFTFLYCLYFVTLTTYSINIPPVMWVIYTYQLKSLYLPNKQQFIFMTINLIYACSKNGVIGRDNNMPWYLPEDLEHFKECTRGFPVIMGRKTWDALPAKFRPLPQRINIVITHSDSWGEEGAIRASNIEDAIEKAKTFETEHIWVIGGAQIYEAAMPYATRAYVTLINETYEGDTYFPELNKNEWDEIERTYFERGENFEHPFSFITYQRAKR